MKLYLTFDVEIWCDGWHDLDGRFPASFDRYVYGRSSSGDFALPKTLEILKRHGLKAVFFVEPLFAARFGVEFLARIVAIIQADGHDVQLHLHAEWTDEIRPLVFPGPPQKRQHLSYYSLEEQITLLTLGRDLLAQAGCDSIKAFRAGSFACNRDTFRALRAVGILIDSSLHEILPDSGIDMRGTFDFLRPLVLDQVVILPLTVFRDGIGKLRPAQVGACGFEEIRDAILSAAAANTQHFVVLSHNFEMLKQRSSEPDRLVVARFERLCAFLAQQAGRIEVSTFSNGSVDIEEGAALSPLPFAGFPATMRRIGEQAVRRVVG
ncbi:hypothetical protein O4H66_10345 [Comamonadaceae bacterium G21597-S1]|nr:hypothetical protein [Comamonadaceae bacterium G21597-S1]